MVQNPFVTSGYIGPEYFCDRVAETEKLTKLLLNGNNVVLMSQRRMGKTGLLAHCFEQEEIRQNYNTFIIDIYSTKNLNDMVYEIGKAILGSPNYTLDQIFEYINSSDQPNIVAIDEFQQIMYYPENNVEEVLRTYIQKCRNAIFVFSGSERHLLSEMFHSPARPFYASTTTFPLGCIPLEKYRDFVTSHFKKAEREVMPEVVDEIYNRFDGVTWFMQKTANQLFADMERGDTCTVGMVETAVNEIIDSNSTIYADLLYQLTSRQKELLLAINREGKAKAITGSRFIKKHNLSSASTIQTTIKALLEKQLITRNLDTYEVYDKFFSIWLSRM